MLMGKKIFTGICATTLCLCALPLGATAADAPTFILETVETTPCTLADNDYCVEVSLTASVAANTVGFGIILDDSVIAIMCNDADATFIEYNGLYWYANAMASVVEAGDTIVTFTVQLSEDVAVGDTIPLALTTTNADGVAGGYISRAYYGDEIETQDGAIVIEKDDYLLGDVDGDGLVSPLDAHQTLIAYASEQVGIDTGFNSLQRLAADVDENGVINALDAHYMLVYYASEQVGLHPTWSDVCG